MHGSRSRRVGAFVISSTFTIVVFVSVLAACDDGGGASRFGAAGTELDEKAACAALDGLSRAGDALNGVDVGDPEPALAALDQAVGAYSTALTTFERIGPAGLRDAAAKVRAAVVARHFTEAAAARAPIDAWAKRNCDS
jgi:hypothetical protein